MRSYEWWDPTKQTSPWELTEKIKMLYFFQVEKTYTFLTDYRTIANIGTYPAVSWLTIEVQFWRVLKAVENV